MSSKQLDLHLEVKGVTWAGNIDMNLISKRSVVATRRVDEMAQNDQVKRGGRWAKDRATLGCPAIWGMARGGGDDKGAQALSYWRWDKNERNKKRGIIDQESVLRRVVSQSGNQPRTLPSHSRWLHKPEGAAEEASWPSPSLQALCWHSVSVVCTAAHCLPVWSWDPQIWLLNTFA